MAPDILGALSGALVGILAMFGGIGILLIVAAALAGRGKPDIWE